MSCGLPVLCTKNSGCNDAVNNYETGIVIEPSNRKQLQDAISWFLLNRDSLEEMGTRARKVSLEYTWENYSRKLTSAIQKCINS